MNSTKKSYFITTYGCQMNEKDSETLAGILSKMGYEAAPQIEQADLILFNTCCVREKAENKVFSQIGRLKKLKSKKPELIIGVCGCMAQQKGMAEKIRRSLPHVDLVFGTHNTHELPFLIQNILALREPQVSIWDIEGAIREDLPSKRDDKFKALVNIMYGCNNFCTYCIVPYVRGRERSRFPEHIIEEIVALVQDGVIEIMLLGQNVNSYGKDFRDRNYDFADLLQEIDQIKGLKRLRYMTSHPRDCTDKLIKAIAQSKTIVHHFHLPVQAGSNNILQRMNRGYTKEEYLDLIARIRQVNPKAVITTDIIVGFPGETEEDFLETLDLISQVRFDNAFTFIYSPRTGTPASKLKDQIPLEKKKERLQKLMNLQNIISKEINDSYLDQIVEVLVEGVSKNNPEILLGKTEGYKTVVFPGKLDLTGQIVKVKITTAQTWILKGILQEKD